MSLESLLTILTQVIFLLVAGSTLIDWTKYRTRARRDILASYENGVNIYVRKPVDFDQFTEAVKQLKLYWVILNETPPDR